MDQDFFAGLLPMASNVDPGDEDFLDCDPASGIGRVRVLDERGVRTPQPSGRPATLPD